MLTTHYMDEAERLCDRVAIVDHGKVIALGTPRELIASLGAEHVVEFAVTGGADGALDAAALERLDGVRRARLNDGRWSLEAVRAGARGAGAPRALAERAPLERARDALRDAGRRVRVAHRQAAARCLRRAREPLPWMSRSLAQLTLVRFREFMREPEAVFWVFIFPVLLAIGLGIAFRNKPADVLTVSVVRGTTGRHARRARLGRAGGLRVRLLTADGAARALRTRRGRAGGDAARRRRAVEYAFDDTRPEDARRASLVDDALQRAAGRRDPVPAAERKVREKGSRYIDFLVPGLLGMNLMGGGIWGLGFAIVDARRRNLLKRLVATPMPRAHYLASFLFSRFILLVFEVVGDPRLRRAALRRAAARIAVQLLVVCVVSALAFGGVGLLIASRPKTIEGASGIMNLVMLPMWVLSGVFFSSSNFPTAAQPFIQALPLTASVNALRGTMLQGIGWGGVSVPLLIVSVWGVVAFGVALRVFRWR